VHVGESGVYACRFGVPDREFLSQKYIILPSDDAEDIYMGVYGLGVIDVLRGIPGSRVSLPGL
jgi:hypothetical protein